MFNSKYSLRLSCWIVHYRTVILIPLEDSANHSTKVILHKYKLQKCLILNILCYVSYISMKDQRLC